MKKIFLLLSTILLSQTSLAKNIGNEGDNTFLFGMSVFYYNLSTDTSHSTNTIYDLKAGHASTKGLYWGVIYSMRNDDLSGASSAGTELGASLGYFGRSGIHAVGHYIFDATLGNGGGAGYTKGSGIQVDFGYLASVSSNFFIGVDMVYRSLTYKQQAGATLGTPYKQTELFPMLSFSFTLM